MTHLTDLQIQGLADGTLRGPEGLEARDHAEACVECDGELQLYAALAGQLSALKDPTPPEDFTLAVMAAVDARETHLMQRRHTLLAAIPAAALALLAIVGWALSSAPGVHVDRLLESAAVVRTVVGVIAPVVEAAKLPLAFGAFAFLAAILTILGRTLRVGDAATARATAS